MLGHPEDCPCCSVRITRTSGSKRKRRDADLATFLPEAEEDPGEEEDGDVEEQPDWVEPEEGEEEGEEQEEATDALLHETLFKSFEAHVERLDAARMRRIETLSFKSALEDDGKDDINEDATQDEIDGLGVWLPGDEFQGDVNYRTLQKLLTRVDQRGFERSAQQLEASPSPSLLMTRLAHARRARAQFHVAFMKAAARVIYRGSWETERPAIMKKYGWETSNSEVLISTPRRFGKTFSCVPRVPACQRLYQPRARVLGSIAIFCACLALAFGLEIGAPLRRPNWRCRSARSRHGTLSAVVFSPARRASRKLLERIVEREAAGQTSRRANAALSCAFLARGRFVRLSGGEKRICEYNQEACRLTAFDGRKSLIRSFPSKVGVSAAATRTVALSRGLGWWWWWWGRVAHWRDGQCG